MARLNDEAKLALILETLENASRGVEGYVSWKPIAWEWIVKNLNSQTRQTIADAMYQHAQAGGEIDEVREKREAHRDDTQFHYDFRLRIESLDVYLETVLAVTRTGPILRVVSAHLKYL